MAFEPEHTPGEVISSADLDRQLLLIKQGVLLQQSGIRLTVKDQIKLTELSPGLAAAILQAIALGVTSTDEFVGDDTEDTFNLTSIPMTNTLQVFVAGILQHNGVDYTVSSLQVIFAMPPILDAWIYCNYRPISGPVISQLGSFILNHEDILEIATIQANSNIVVYGTNKETDALNVAIYDPISLTQLSSDINVDGATPQNLRLVYNTVNTVPYIWAIGSASSAQNITKINAITYDTTIITVTADVSATISSLTTDGVAIYAFIKGGITSPNAVAKINASTNVIEGFAAATLVSSTGDVDMIVGSDGYLYVSLSDVSGTAAGQVRKYDLGTGAETIFDFSEDVDPIPAHSIRVVAAPSSVLVLDDDRQKVYNIAINEEVTELIELDYVPTNIQVYGSDIWISSGSTLYKYNSVGTLIGSVTPSTKTIQYVSGDNTCTLWVAYSDDTGVNDPNITKIYPGLPGE